MKYISKALHFLAEMIIDNWMIWGIVIVLVLAFVPARVMSGSMETTLMTGDRVLARRTYWSYQPQRGDIVLFDFGDDIYVKRVIGLPGDTVTFDLGRVVVNGELLDEPYLDEQGITYPARLEEYKVPRGKIFVLGDNRRTSQDARYWSDPYINTKKVKGVYLFTLIHARK